MTTAPVGAQPGAPAPPTGLERSTPTARKANQAAWWSRAMPWAPRVTTYLLGALVFLGLFLRVRRIDLPENFTFDEALFVKNAHHYLIGNADDNDHPPLGKILMAIGHIAFDYNSLGWRFTSVCFGVLTVYVAYLLGKTLFADARAGYFAAALVAADGFFIAYSRAGLLDGVLCCLILWTVLAAANARSFGDVLITGVLLGLATSVKWSGAFAVFPAALALVLLQRLPWYWVPALGVSLVVHFAIWKLGLQLTGRPHDVASMVGVMKRLFHHHLDLGSRDNDLASKWYSWLYLYHPIVVKLSQVGKLSRYASSAGNPLIWALGTLSVIGLPLYLAAREALRLLKTRLKLKGFALPRLLDSRRARAVLVLALGWLALIFPWMIARGKYTFYYHYLPSYAFVVVLVAGCLSLVERRNKALTCGIVAAAAAIALYFVPVWGEFPINEQTANRRLLFKPWRP